MGKFVCMSQAQMVVQGFDTRFILIRAERPYVQFDLLQSCTQFVVGITNGQERERGSQVSGLRVHMLGESVYSRSPTQGHPYSLL